MKGYLLDRHVLLWCLAQPTKLDDRLNRLLAETSMPLFASIASLWELSIKHSIGKLVLPAGLIDMLEQTGIRLLPITLEHTAMIQTLPLHHRDPFDRMLVAHSFVNDLTMVSRDARLAAYNIALIRA